MKDVVYSTSNEKKLIQAIQRAVGAYDNGIIGTQTLSDAAIALKADGCWPLTVQMYGYPVIIAKDLIAFSPKGPLKSYANSMVGSFTYPRAEDPCSILINNGETVWGTACHAHVGKPESVLYRKKDGTFGVKRAVYWGDLPNDIRWGVGGMGLLDMYDPEAEGFEGAYADVLRKTDHCVLAVKNGMVYGVYYKAMTAAQINKHCRERMRFDIAVLLDGGGLAAINGGEGFAKINAGARQGYALQFV